MLIFAVQLTLRKFTPPLLLPVIHLLMNLLNKTFKEQLRIWFGLAAFAVRTFEAVNFLPALQAIGEKRAAPDSGKKPKTPKKKKKKDPNEPQKPVSAYALFFRDTQAAIKGQNPNATFGEVSKIVASMWDSLGEEQKQVRQRSTATILFKKLAEYFSRLLRVNVHLMRLFLRKAFSKLWDLETQLCKSKPLSPDTQIPQAPLRVCVRNPFRGAVGEIQAISCKRTLLMIIFSL